MTDVELKLLMINDRVAPDDPVRKVFQHLEGMYEELESMTDEHLDKILRCVHENWILNGGLSDVVDVKENNRYKYALGGMIKAVVDARRR